MSAKSFKGLAHSLWLNLGEWATGNTLNVGGFSAVVGILATIATGLIPVFGVLPMVITAVALLALTCVPPLAAEHWKKQQPQSSEDVAVRGIVLSGHLSRAIQKLASQAGDSAHDRMKYVDHLAEKVCTSVVASFGNINGVRCSVFRLSEDKKQMRLLDSFGRVDRPETFTTNDARGRQALKWVLAGGDSVKFVLDNRKSKSKKSTKSGKPYQTYVSIRVKTATETYGMLTIDSLESGDLALEDSHLLTVYAAIIALGIAESERDT
ncbi:hypothetical protein PGC08_14325 [Brevibacterium sp. BDJS002]|uniref:hypothetical protein n=1 Tax=Brevibacterium sp. BDJS002 TaxID=3020906 RepID=UPI0023074EC1|nr:hypothetical protein [Brevibacterium sp. BDJS002]WCE39166.1 hypothetical protein PGC08_14325 [Brevibacterium sp. BDJS002]